jgi:hypothetical protein
MAATTAETAATEVAATEVAATADAFNLMKVLEGRGAHTKNAGSANTWFPNAVPRPDLTYSEIWWYALGALNDFAERSPYTGLAKWSLLITGIIFMMAQATGAVAFILAFVLWWLWDILQISFEKDFIMTYGMTDPTENFATGIAGGGMITDGVTNYRQRANFTLWQLFSLFGFTGLDALVSGKPALFVRKFFDTAMFSGYAIGFIKGWINGTVSDIGLFFLFMFASLFGFFVVIPWVTTFSAMSSPSTLFREGIKVSPALEKFLNFFNMWTGAVGPNTKSEVAREFGVGSVSAENMKRDFEIFFKDPTEVVTEDESSDTDKAANSDTWMMSLGLGNIVTGPIAALVAYFVPMLRFGIEGKYAIAKTLRGEVPQVPISMIPGAEQMIDKAKDAARKVQSRLPELQKSMGGLYSSIDKAVAVGQQVRDATNAIGQPSAPPVQTGGSRGKRDEPLSTEAIALGATVFAAVAGGAVVLAVDYLMPQ